MGTPDGAQRLLGPPHCAGGVPCERQQHGLLPLIDRRVNGYEIQNRLVVTFDRLKTRPHDVPVDVRLLGFGDCDQLEDLGARRRVVHQPRREQPVLERRGPTAGSGFSEGQMSLSKELIGAPHVVG